MLKFAGMSCRILMRQNASQMLFANRTVSYEVKWSQREVGRYLGSFVSCRHHSTKNTRQPKLPLPTNYFITTPIYYLNAGTNAIYKLNNRCALEQAFRVELYCACTCV